MNHHYQTQGNQEEKENTILTYLTNGPEVRLLPQPVCLRLSRRSRNRIVMFQGGGGGGSQTLSHETLSRRNSSLKTPLCGPDKLSNSGSPPEMEFGEPQKWLETSFWHYGKLDCATRFAKLNRSYATPKAPSPDSLSSPIGSPWSTPERLSEVIIVGRDYTYLYYLAAVFFYLHSRMTHIGNWHLIRKILLAWTGSICGRNVNVTHEFWVKYQ